MTDDALLALDAYWRAANYLTVGQNDPARDGAVLPILHLNGYKISARPSSVVSATREYG